MPTSNGPHLSEIDDKDIREALIKEHGVIGFVAKLFKVDRSNLAKRIKKNPDLMAAMEEAKEAMLDLTETTLFKRAYDVRDDKRGDTLLMFILRCHGKKRGWVERQEVTGEGGAPLGQVVAPVRALNAAEWAKQNREAG